MSSNLRVLAIDPSGTGTSGVYFKYLDREAFHQFTGKEWIKHFEFILDLVEEYQPNLLLFENSNYVSLRGKDMTYLWKLLGAVEALSCGYTWMQIKGVPVDQVKRLRGKLLKGEQKIEGLEYQPGKGWHHNGKKINTHCLDAYLVYWLWQTKEQNDKLIGESMSATKSKAELKTNHYE